MGSGNLVHNLHAFGACRRAEAATRDWARAFDAGVARALESHDATSLALALQSEEGRLAHPTPDHYLLRLYAVGTSTPDDRVRFPIQGFDMASISMRSAILG